MSLSLPLFTLLDKYVVRDGVPGIVNANKEEEQRRSAKDEPSWARMGASQVRRSSQHCIRRKWKQNMKQPVLEHGLEPLEEVPSVVHQHRHLNRPRMQCW